MARRKSISRGGEAWALAASQHGIVSRLQLLALGISEEGIDHRIRSGRLHPVTSGVYAVGRPAETRLQHWMAAVLTVGPLAMLSHRSAAALWGVIRSDGARIELSAIGRRAGKRDGIKVHSRTALPPGAVATRAGIPLTAIVPTIIDLATMIGEGPLERVVNEADKLDLVDPETLRKEIEVYRGRRGARRLRRLLDRHTFRLSDSDLERLFRPIATAAGVPVDETKAWVVGVEVDFHWPRLRFVVETDGLRYHRTPASQARDRRRDQELTAAGYVSLRFTHHQVC